jgi:hypothetical protein
MNVAFWLMNIGLLVLNRGVATRAPRCDANMDEVRF